MKRIIIPLLLLAMVVLAFTSDKATKEQYCELVATQKLLSKRVTIQVNYGRATKFIEDTRMKDENGNVMEFNNTVDALIFMGEKGWELHSTMLLSSGNSNVYHFIFKRDVQL